MRQVLFFCILIALCTLLCAPNPGFGQSRKALVIGNSAYAEVPLNNPGNDATDLASTLRALGFDVSLMKNLDHRSMEDAIRNFGTSVKPGDVALFYFSGHGTQVDGLNYLIPVNEQVRSEIDVKYHCVEAGFVLDHLEQSRAGVNIIILDACRNNPFQGYRSGNRGFAYMSAPTGSIIAYSTAPGSVAQDGSGRNSPFTKNLIEKIQSPGLKIEEVFKEVRKEVAAETGRQQIPWESSSLMGDFYFNKENVPINIPQETESSTTYYPHESFSGSSGTFTDTRDVQKYKWVRIGQQIWMAENLNYNTGNSWCYENNSSNCEKYGRLYDWNAALKACPPGWHLPSDQEWNNLINCLGSTAGNDLKSVSGWNRGGNGTNNYGFSALPRGYRSRNGNFHDVGSNGDFWSSTEYGSSRAWYLILYYRTADVGFGLHSKGIGFSVRCLRD
ncbi:MAG: caspase family protein [Bacteroidetes bacterium]|nr:caspase family protein [Bacteroidota bacterium]